MSHSHKVHPRLRRLAGVALATLATWQLPVQRAAAQEGLRESVAGERAAALRRADLMDRPRSFSVGEARVLLSASAGIEYNNNIFLAEQETRDDLILLPGVNAHVTWPISPSATLDSSLGITYWKYVGGTTQDRLVLQPGSGIAFEGSIHDVHIRLHDDLSYTRDPVVIGALSGVAELAMFSNVAGMAATWDINRFIIGLSYDHILQASATRQFNYLDRSSDVLTLRPAVHITPYSDVGIEASQGWNDYRRDVLGDSVDRSLGVYTSLTLTDALKVEARTGYSSYQFHESPAGYPKHSDHLFYLGLEARHVPTAHFNHALELTRELQLGANSELLGLWRVRESFQWKAGRQVDLSGNAFYELGDETGRSVLILPESYTRFGVTLEATYTLTQHSELRLVNQLVEKSSALPLRGYLQNRVSLSYTYRF